MTTESDRKRSRTGIAALSSAVLVLALAGCSDPRPVRRPAASTTTSEAQPTTTSDRHSTTTALVRGGVVPAGGPISFGVKVEGWTYRVDIARIASLHAEVAPDTSRPSPATEADIVRSGDLDATVTSLDAGRRAPRLDLGLMLMYPGYTGDTITTASSIHCVNDFSVTETGPHLVSPEGAATDPTQLFCRDVYTYSTWDDYRGAVFPYGVSITAIPFNDDAEAQAFTSYFNAVNDPSAYLDIGNDRFACRVQLTPTGVVPIPFDGPDGSVGCELTG